MNSIKNISKRALLVILDGFGINEKSPQNAIKDAHKPNIDFLFSHYPFTTIECGGEMVGLPNGIRGNSEVGHLNLGSGQPVRQDLVRINEAIEQKKFEHLELFKELINKAKAGSKRIHLMGLLSDGGVHSHIDHIKEVILLLNKHQGLQVFFHAFMDGRDTPQADGIKYIEQLKKIPGFKFASLQGRSIGMDRDRRWEKIEKAYKTFIGRGFISSTDPVAYMEENYKKGIFDEFVEPVLFDENAKIESGDQLFFLNFRPDRAVQLSLAFCDPNFREFPTPVRPNYFLCMTPYIPDEVSLPILFDKENIPGTLSEYLSGLGLKQFKIAETEKYAHVTYFFNGGEKKPFPGEEHVLIPSPKEVATYDLKPQMSAELVTDRLVSALENSQISFYLVNFANSDMVGHTGNYKAAVKAIETLDVCVKRLVDVCEKTNTALILTADHGNSDQMAYEDGSPHTSHTLAPAPFVIFHPKLKDQKINKGNGNYALKDVAPTVLEVLGIPIPKQMVGTSIFN